VNWYQTFLVSLASLAIMFVAGHFLWPATHLVEIPGKVVLDSAATQALEIRLDSVRAELRSVYVRAMRDRAALSRARGLYADLTHRLDSLENLPGEIVETDWPGAMYDTTVQRVTPLEITIGDSVERREVTQEIRFAGEHVLPPFNVFRNVSVSVTPSAIYYSRQLPGKTVETVEVIRWPWLPVVAGYLGGTIITTLIVLLISGASN
jgi:hypothetical protein